MDSLQDGGIEKLLRCWAYWCIKNSDSGMGFPRRSIIGRLIDEGSCLTKWTGPKPLPVNDTAELVESMIVDMYKSYHPNIANSIREQYIQHGTQAHKARNLGVSTAQYKIHLNMGKAWLAGRLTGRMTLY